jgi:hypothetical protein
MRENARYQELSAELGNERENIKAVTLKKSADIK